MAKRKKKPKGPSSAKPFCVYSPKRKLVSCFAERTSAENMAKGMNKNRHKRKLPGPGFSVLLRGKNA